MSRGHARATVLWHQVPAHAAEAFCSPGAIDQFVRHNVSWRTWVRRRTQRRHLVRWNAKCAYQIAWCWIASIGLHRRGDRFTSKAAGSRFGKDIEVYLHRSTRDFPAQRQQSGSAGAAGAGARSARRLCIVLNHRRRNRIKVGHFLFEEDRAARSTHRPSHAGRQRLRRFRVVFAARHQPASHRVILDPVSLAIRLRWEDDGLRRNRSLRSPPKVLNI